MEMTAAEIRSKIKIELEHIPQGDRVQNQFRSAYRQWRESHLKENPDTKPMAAIFEAVRTTRGRHPGAHPIYDLDWFTEQPPMWG
jgi:hypothetical protein